MKACPFCNANVDDAARFCPTCGQQIPAEAPVYAPPVEQLAAPAFQPSNYTPQVPSYQLPTQTPDAAYYGTPAPVTNPPSKGKIITGMILGIAGLALAATGLLYTVLYFCIGLSEAEMMFAAFLVGLITAVFSLPLSIVGFVMSNKTFAQGSTSKMSTLGKRFGLIGTLLSLGMVVLAAIGLVCYITYWII